MARNAGCCVSRSHSHRSRAERTVTISTAKPAASSSNWLKPGRTPKISAWPPHTSKQICKQICQCSRSSPLMSCVLDQVGAGKGLMPRTIHQRCPTCMSWPASLLSSADIQPVPQQLARQHKPWRARVHTSRDGQGVEGASRQELPAHRAHGGPWAEVLKVSRESVLRLHQRSSRHSMGDSKGFSGSTDWFVTWRGSRRSAIHRALLQTAATHILAPTCRRRPLSSLQASGIAACPQTEPHTDAASDAPRRY